MLNAKINDLELFYWKQIFKKNADDNFISIYEVIKLIRYNFEKKSALIKKLGQVTLYKSMQQHIFNELDQAIDI